MKDYGFKPSGLIGITSKQHLVFPSGDISKKSISNLSLPSKKMIDWDLDSTPTLHLCGRIGPWESEKDRPFTDAVKNSEKNTRTSWQLWF
jgi:hypothetical protein